MGSIWFAWGMGVSRVFMRQFNPLGIIVRVKMPAWACCRLKRSWCVLLLGTLAVIVLAAEEVPKDASSMHHTSHHSLPARCMTSK